MEYLLPGDSAKKYLQELKRNLNCKPKKKKLILKEIAEEICYFCQDENTSYIEICSRFGMPEHIAHELCDNSHNEKKKHDFKVAILSVAATLGILGCGLAMQDVGIINEFFFPKLGGVALPMNDSVEWRNVVFDNNEEYFSFKGPFWDKEIIVEPGMEWDSEPVCIRIKDEKENIILDNIVTETGKSIDVSELDRNTNYQVEIQSNAERVDFNIV